VELYRCHHCNAVFPDSLTTCPRCGRDPDPPSRFKKIGWIVGVITALAVAAMMIAGR
jgi:hypothetical protein